MRIDRIAQFRYKTLDLRCKASPASWFFSGSTGGSVDRDSILSVAKPFPALRVFQPLGDVDPKRVSNWLE
jgi:hypothetical protein